MSEFPDRPFTAAELPDLALTKRRLAQAVSSRCVRRVLRGVYVRSDVPDTTTTRAQAAALVISPFAVACDRTAAWLHGVDVFEGRQSEVLPPVETYVLRGHHRPERRGCVGGERDLRPDEICLVGGVKVTTPVRTALDLGCRLSRRDGLAALDAMMRACAISPAELERLLPRYAGRRGVVQLRELLPLADPRAESPGESWTRLVIIEAGLPAPVPQFWVHVDGVPTFRLDLAYPLARVAVEYDGHEFHTSEAQRAHDLARRQWLLEHGWTVIVVAKESFTNRTLDGWLRELRTALGLLPA